MKRNLLFFVLSFFLCQHTAVLAQQKILVQAHDIITLEKMGNKSEKLPYMTSQHAKFSTSGKYLFLQVGDPQYGKPVMLVYNVPDKKTEKVFPLPNIKDFYGTLSFFLNPDNEFELIVQTAKKEAIYLPDWSKETEEVFTERKKAFRTDRVILKVPEYSQVGFTPDGKNIYIQKSSLVYDIFDKKGEKIDTKKFTKADGEFAIFIGGNTFVLGETKKSKIDGLQEHTLKVFNIAENQVKASFMNYVTLQNKGFGSPMIFSTGFNSYDLAAGKEIESVAKAKKNLSGPYSVFPIPNTNGLFVHNHSSKGAFFTTEDSQTVSTPFGPGMNNVSSCFQVSPNGKYFLMGVEGVNHLVIFSLY